MKSYLKSIVNFLGLEITRRHLIESRARKIYRQYADFTMIPEGLYVDNLKLLWQHRHIEGCVVECGVWRGGMSAGMATLLPDREFYLFDSFEGLPEAKLVDGDRALAWQKNTSGPTYYDNCKAEIEFAERLMAGTGSVHHLMKGWFSETLPVNSIENKIAVLRLDADWYDSTMDCLTYLFTKVAKNGIIIFDDYYTWDGCSRAVHDYLSKIKSVSRIHKTPLGVAFIIKQD